MLVGVGLGAAVVEEHRVDFFRPVLLARLAGPEIMLKWVVTFWLVAEREQREEGARVRAFDHLSMPVMAT